MATIGYDHETARRVDLGLECPDRGASFTAANGKRSSCSYCHRRGSEYPLSQHPEANKEAHANEARKRRKARESK